jgi:hypothetical protein
VATISSGLTKAFVGLSDLFSKRAWPLVQVLLAGAILAVGPRTISAVLRPIVIVADSSFAALELLDATRRKICVVTRLRLDAALYDPAPTRAPGMIGRPRRKGATANTESHIDCQRHPLACRNIVSMVRPGRHGNSAAMV